MRGKRKETPEDRKWKKAVKEKDGNECVICGKIDYINAHHIIPIEIKETKHDIDNGITLCPSHHRYSRQLSAHQNPLAFIMWMEKNRPMQLKYLKTIIDENKKCKT